jgi:4-hydroxy-3-methylbut-2-en-1-yl diphosphate reductase
VNRSLRNQVLSASPGGKPVVATRFTHPELGAVTCHAAPLLRAWLAQEMPDAQVEMGDVAVPPPGQGDGALVSVTYLDRDGSPHGFGVAADARWLPRVRAAADGWQPLMRSRRLLVAGAGPGCAGTTRALGLVSAASAGGPVRVIGQSAAPGDELQALAGRDVQVIEHPDQADDQMTVAFPAHGVSPGMRTAAAARGLAVIDGTCPLVATAHADAHAYADRGDTVVLIGEPHSAAAPVLAAQASDAAVIVSDAAQVVGLTVADPARVSFIAVPGALSERVRAVVAALRLKYPMLRGHHYDSWCSSADDRAASVAMIAASSDLTLILGRADDPDAAALAAMARQAGAAPQVIDAATKIRPGWLRGTDAIGVAVALSAAPRLTMQVRSVLSGLGPLTVVTRASHTAVKSREEEMAL